MKYQTSSKIKVLKRLWIVLKELEIDALLTGGEIDLNINALLDRLFIENKLNEVCQIITGTKDDFEEMELEEVAELLQNFFASISKPLVDLSGIAKPTKKTKG